MIRHFVHLVVLALLLPTFAEAWNPALFSGPSTSGGACSSSNDGVQVDFGAGTTTNTNNYACAKFTLASTITLTGYMADACFASTGTGNLTMSLYTHNSGTDVPDTQITNSNANIAHTALDVCTTHGQKEVLLATPITLQAGTYWMCYYHNGGQVAITQYYKSLGGGRLTAGGTPQSGPNAGYTIGGQVLGCAP